jgi:predicted metallo-beta-lactamase superfamily hydrolase
LVTIKFWFDNIKSAMEYGARININCPLEGVTDDLLERARKELKQYRENGWESFSQDVPLYNWEKN